MNETRKNIIVGVFVIVGLIALGTMIVLFGEAPKALTSSYNVTMSFPQAGSVSPEDPIYMNGIPIGTVATVTPRSDIREGVRIVCRIEWRYDIPVDAEPIIKQQTMTFGSASIGLTVGPDNSSKSLAKDGSATLEGITIGGIEELIPRETLDRIEQAGNKMVTLAEKLVPVAEDLHNLLKRTPVEQVDSTTQPDRPLANLSTAVQRFDMALKNFNEVMGDPENQRNLANILKNFRTVSERGADFANRLLTLADKVESLADNTDSRVTELSRSLMRNIAQLTKIFDNINTASAALTTEKGTAGRLLNDPELYEVLTESTRKLAIAIDEIKALIIQWQEKGLKIEGGLLGN